MSEFRLAARPIGGDHPCFVIAELGSNHDGSLERARALVDAAAAAGADAVKVQSFTAAGMVNRHLGSSRDGAPEHPAWDTLERLTVPDAWHAALMAHAAARGVVFLSAPFDEERAALLDRVGVAAFKLASSEITNLPLLHAVARYGRPVILSTGLATEAEVEAATAALRAEGLGDFALLHCVSQYPTKFEEVNLRAIPTIARLAPVVGFSDHTPGISAPLGAVALGAKIVEKHVTDKRPGPDHGYALEMDELAAMVRGIRELERALGDGVKRPSPGEEAERGFSFRGVYATRALPAGTLLGEEHLKCVRPATAIGPGDLPALLGSTLATDVPAHAALRWEDVAPGRG